MQIVIDIPDEMYEVYHKQPPMLGDAGIDSIVQAIAKGTPLPKGHGDLIDRSKLETTDVSPEPWYSPMWAYSEWMIDDAEVVIPADKEDAE